jgi:hypothetical protein
METNKKYRKKQKKIGNLIISKVAKIWKKKFIQISITSSKLKIEIQIFFQKLASVDFGFQKCMGSNGKKSLFSKKKQKKKQFSKFRQDRKKHFRKKVLLRSSYIHYETQCSKNQPNRRWSLVTRSILTKTALKNCILVKTYL